MYDTKLEMPKITLTKWTIDKHIDPERKWCIGKMIGADQKEHFFVTNRISKTPFCSKHVKNSEDDVVKYIQSISHKDQSLCLICGPHDKKKSKVEYEQGQGPVPLEELQKEAGLKYKQPGIFVFKFQVITEPKAREYLKEIIFYRNELLRKTSISNVSEFLDKMTKEFSYYEDLIDIAKEYKNFYNEIDNPEIYEESRRASRKKREERMRKELELEKEESQSQSQLQKESEKEGKQEIPLSEGGEEDLEKMGEEGFETGEEEEGEEDFDWIEFEETQKELGKMTIEETKKLLEEERKNAKAHPRFPEKMETESIATEIRALRELANLKNEGNITQENEYRDLDDLIDLVVEYTEKKNIFEKRREDVILRPMGQKQKTELLTKEGKEEYDPTEIQPEPVAPKRQGSKGKSKKKFPPSKEMIELRDKLREDTNVVYTGPEKEEDKSNIFTEIEGLKDILKYINQIGDPNKEPRSKEYTTIFQLYALLVEYEDIVNSLGMGKASPQNIKLRNDWRVSSSVKYTGNVEIDNAKDVAEEIELLNRIDFIYYEIDEDLSPEQNTYNDMASLRNLHKIYENLYQKDAESKGEKITEMELGTEKMEPSTEKMELGTEKQNLIGPIYSVIIVAVEGDEQFGKFGGFSVTRDQYLRNCPFNFIDFESAVKSMEALLKYVDHYDLDLEIDICATPIYQSDMKYMGTEILHRDFHSAKEEIEIFRDSQPQ